MNILEKVAAASGKPFTRNLEANIENMGKGVGRIAGAVPGAFNKVNEWAGSAYKDSAGNTIKTFGNKIGDIKGKALNWVTTPILGRGHNTFNTNNTMTNGQMAARNVKNIVGIGRAITGNTFANKVTNGLTQNQDQQLYDAYGRPVDVRGGR